MGEQADYIINQMIDDYWDNYVPTKKIKSGYWKPKDSPLMKISDMEQRHLDNAIRYLERTGGNDIKLREMIAENNKRMDRGVPPMDHDPRDDDGLFK